ncbi:SDR family oxidoreductase [Paenilisteria rocourtiae]|uniref:NAD(P)-dependent dehydrogenase (Short-subunit alcohol dehydrogenase family) n=1 Tax=Listeria rocourtiae TaxID=647910 RepID=A0A4R6ZTI5_9LIST|nr:SDR family oxidoreductase [Listeria rocourtiae]EUJ47225.1 3-ketoacyl-(acyl-carrier-protein) reductase [Listeria rocourtiae FSL F6-920]TDR55772.1 NAD(P)-dependent dehydrogenase (short-subunit alcohol dehydrogenase family) [Listeria rocourtiae]
MGKLVGKVAVVTGAASGMGRQIALLFAKEGAKVVVADIQLEAAEDTVTEIKASEGEALAVVANVMKEDDVQAMIDKAVEAYGTLDILINNAGIMDNFVPAGEITDELWDRVFAINTTGVMRTTRKALPIFEKQESGVIVNIASAGGLFGSRAGAAYTASKHAVVGFTKNVGFQYATKNIRCNAIAPGAVETNIGTTLYAPDEFGQARAMIGMGTNPRVGQASEIAKVALFLASEDASFVNGTVVTADAGWTAY